MKGVGSLKGVMAKILKVGEGYEVETRIKGIKYVGYPSTTREGAFKGLIKSLKEVIEEEQKHNKQTNKILNRIIRIANKL